jgi:hypothetical protein
MDAGRNPGEPGGSFEVGGLGSNRLSDGLNNQDGLTIHRWNDSQFGKAGAMGDLELLCDQAPIEVGNRVWLDVNNNGQQDPAEPPLAGVNVVLMASDAVTQLGSAITDASGRYLFSSAPGTSTGSFVYGIDSLTPNTTGFRVTINPNSTPNQTALAGLTLTSATQPAVASDPSATDSDSNAAVLVSEHIAIVDTGDPGVNDHTIDFGYLPTYSLGNRAWVDTDNDRQLDTGESGLASVTMELLRADGSSIDPDGVGPLTQTLTATNSSGHYRFDRLPAGSYRVRATAIGHNSSTPDDATPNNDTDALGAPSDNGIGTGSSPVSEVVTLGGTNEPSSEIDVVSGANPQGTLDYTANMTVDFGFVPVPVATTTTTTTSSTTTTTSSTTTTSTPAATTSTTLPGSTTSTTIVPASSTTTTTTSTVTASTVPPLIEFTPQPSTTSTTSTPPVSTTTAPTTAPVTLSTSTIAASPVTVPVRLPGQPVCVVTGSVFVDANRNGRRDATERGLPSVPVTVVLSNGERREVLSDANGNYRVDSVPTGVVSVSIDTQRAPTNGPATRVTETRNCDANGVATLQTEGLDFGLLDEDDVRLKVLPELALTATGTSRLLTYTGLSVIAAGLILLWPSRRAPGHARELKRSHTEK